MSATQIRPEAAAGHLDRRDVLRGAAAIVAGDVALASQDGIAAQPDEQARADSFQESTPNETVAELRAFLSV